MSDTKILQAIFSTVTNLRDDVKRVEKKVDKVDKKTTERLDKIGLQLAYLEDDTPTIEDHTKLKRRVKKLEIRMDSMAKN